MALLLQLGPVELCNSTPFPSWPAGTSQHCAKPSEWLGFTSAGFSLSALNMPSNCLSIHLLQSHEKQNWLLQNLVSLLETDAALLAGVSEDILCFSRSFEDLTCFWDEEETTTGMCHFYYWYSRRRHVCVFPSQDVRLFTELHLRVLNATTNHTKYGRELSVDAVGLIAPPANITARWAGAAGQLCVSWQPPLADFLNFFLYERLVQANTWVVLQDLQPGVRYHIQVRSKPDGTSMDGVWGPWSQAVAAETPRSSGDIRLCCSTPDLRHVRCEWSWDPAEPHSSHQLFYRPPPSGPGTREDAWEECEEVSREAQSTHACTFQPKAGSAISVLVNVTRTHMLPTLSYFKEPFWLHQAVLTDAPQLVQATVSQGRLSLQWLPPLEPLAEQLDYQVRYATENSHDWKVLQVPRAARKEVLDLRPGTRYHAQVRAQPSGPWYQGSWSAWSKPVMVDAMADTGEQQARPSEGLGQGSSAPPGGSSKGSAYSVHSVSPQASAFDKQPPEEAVVPCLLEVLPGPRREAGQPPEHAGGRLSSTDIANQSYLLMSGWEPRGATTAPSPP
ncbi:hypothetical protein DUI87_14814 [Hirundo rustica rustica]|uniref:Fibronectin type-III domain-containing protein n=1 Tax=Hirundo rustica rustica TaxID=333673 RepID=A0A3M0KMY4_HIRRU|nr:hypothetical protein DUI87_14814 [Hirundo rustica rustica]